MYATSSLMSRNGGDCRDGDDRTGMGIMAGQGCEWQDRNGDGRTEMAMVSHGQAGKRWTWQEKVEKAMERHTLTLQGMAWNQLNGMGPRNSAKITWHACKWETFLCAIPVHVHTCAWEVMYRISIEFNRDSPVTQGRFTIFWGCLKGKPMKHSRE